MHAFNGASVEFRAGDEHDNNTAITAGDRSGHPRDLEHRSACCGLPCDGLPGRAGARSGIGSAGRPRSSRHAASIPGRSAAYRSCGSSGAGIPGSRSELLPTTVIAGAASIRLYQSYNRDQTASDRARV